MNPNQIRANRLIASGHPFGMSTMQFLTWVAMCAFDPRDTGILDKIERDMRQAA